jgi:transcriptional regulator of heat shock response
MVRLTKPFPSIINTHRQITKLIETFIQEKHWKSFSSQKPLLVMTPFLTLEFEAFNEKEIEGKGKVITNSIHKSAALNAVTLQLDDSVVKDLKDSENFELAGDEKHNILNDTKNKILSASASSKELKELALVRLSEKFQVPRENIIITKIKEVFLPIWEVECNIEQHSLGLFVNAVNNRLMNEQDLPMREKGWLELTQDMLNDLQNPRTWIEYSKDLLSSVPKISVATNQGKTGTTDKPNEKSTQPNRLKQLINSISDPNVQIVVLILAFLLLIFLTLNF